MYAETKALRMKIDAKIKSLDGAPAREEFKAVMAGTFTEIMDNIDRWKPTPVPVEKVNATDTGGSAAPAQPAVAEPPEAGAGTQPAPEETQPPADPAEQIDPPAPGEPPEAQPAEGGEAPGPAVKPTQTPAQ